VNNKSADFYEQKYLNEKEPWGYNKYAVEILRHKFVVQSALNLKTEYNRILDVGCGKGNLTFCLDGLSQEIVGMDISKTAIEKSLNFLQNNLSNKNTAQYRFVNSSILDISFPENHFDLILLCDGISEWFSDDKDKLSALQKTNDLLAPGGFVILSDYQKPGHFGIYVDFISGSSLKIEKLLFLNDRLCYQFYSWFKKIEEYRITKMVFGSIIIARLLMSISSLFGKNGSKHIFVIARKM
jgi:SAM-dependent methyltransferase